MQEGEEPTRRPPAADGELARYSGYGLTWVLTVLLLGWGGLTLDERLGTTPLLVLSGSLLGIVGGFYRFYRGLIVEPERTKKEAPGRREEHQ